MLEARRPPAVLSQATAHRYIDTSDANPCLPLAPCWGSVAHGDTRKMALEVQDAHRHDVWHRRRFRLSRKLHKSFFVFENRMQVALTFFSSVGRPRIAIVRCCSGFAVHTNMLRFLVTIILGLICDVVLVRGCRAFSF